MPKIEGYNDAWDEHDSRAMWSAYLQDDIPERLLQRSAVRDAVCAVQRRSVRHRQWLQCGTAIGKRAEIPRDGGPDLDFDGWHVDLQGRYVGQQEINAYSTGLPATTSTVASGPTKIPDYFLVNVGIIKVIPLEGVGPAKALRLGLHIDNLFDKHYYSEGETNTEITDPNTGATQNDFYGITGEPRAVFAA